jgi:hypothetical protein
MIELLHQEAIALYRFLKPREEVLGADLIPLLRKIERALYEGMSIEDVEQLTECGENGK